MPLLETLTLGLGPAFAKAVLKLWLPDHPLVTAAGDGVVDMMKKRGENFATTDATDRLFRNLASEVADRLQKVVELEFPHLAEQERDAAALSVADVLNKLELSSALMRAGLDAPGLEQAAKLVAESLFKDLGDDSRSLAELILTEACSYAVAVAGKLPDFQVAATRELLRRTAEISGELSRVLDAVGSMREFSASDNTGAAFETKYRRSLSQRLDRMQLFGIRLVGSGAREPEISVAYVTLTSSQTGSASQAVDFALAGKTKIVIRGEAGSGKTTLLRWLAIHAARRTFEDGLAPWNPRIPFVVTLRDYADAAYPPPETFVTNLVSNLSGLMPAGWAQQRLSIGALVLIDGLDEVPLARRGALYEWIRGLIDDFPNSIFVLSSRPAALDAKQQGTTTAKRLTHLGFEQITLNSMTLRDSEALITLWHRAVGRDFTDRDERERLRKNERDLIGVLRDRPAIRTLASNPLLCSMVCVLNWDRKQRLPDNRMQLYGIALEMLIDTRDADRGVMGAGAVEIDSQAKGQLLDGLAYWMMRNGLTEADRDDTETQIGVLLLRMPKLIQSPEQVLQELLERTGVLREPQVGTIDFVHRTFMEYMAARAAVNSGDLGLLAEHAKEDIWRETIVFAAGHAQGTQRDALLSRILKRPFFKLSRRSISAEVTAACCLETASSNLAPELLAELMDCAKNLFPPRTPEMARILAPAAALEPQLLKGYSDELEVAMCIRCAASIGGEALLRVIESYVYVLGSRVWRELLAAWTSFDLEAFLQRVVLARRGQKFGELKIDEMDEESLLVFRYLALNGAFDRDDDESGKSILETFISRRELRISDENAPEKQSPLENIISNVTFEKDAVLKKQPLSVFTESDFHLISRVAGLRGLYTGLCEPGVIRLLSNFELLTSLGCRAANPREYTEMQRFKRLTELSISGLHTGWEAQEIDLKAVSQCAQLRELRIKHSQEVTFLLPKMNIVKSVQFSYVTDKTFQELKNFEMAESMWLQGKRFSSTISNLRRFEKLRELVIAFSGSVDIIVPDNLKTLTVFYADVLNIKCDTELAHIERIYAKDVTTINEIENLLKLKTLRRLTVTEEIARQIRGLIGRERSTIILD